ncbi:MAG: XdhC/CoxI family protein [Planctomycetota bacterium]|nr:MAG: XdhC/CoxI family protein [Planctomycetota bacterium]
MRELLDELTAAIARGNGVACCRLVETRGSTPQKPGAAMLVFPDGSQAGTLGGGCVEAEVKRQALATLGRGNAEVVKFQLDDDYGWDDGLICGGRMQVLIDPLAATPDREYVARLQALARDGMGATEAIVFDAEASGLPAGASYLFDAEGALAASVRGPVEGGAAPQAVRDGLKSLQERPRPYAAGGIAYLPLLSRCRLVIVGGGHVGQAVAALAADLDFDVWVVDDRAEFVTPERFPKAERRIAGTMGDVLPGLEITPNTYCLIVTRGHNHDEEALYHLIDRKARYLGMIGSKRKIKLIFDDLRAEGISAESLGEVYAPVGLDIGSQTVMEIAVSIAAELIAHRNLGIAGHHTRQRAAVAG